jgi:nucleotide-binding universal stress UspA family protein
MKTILVCTDFTSGSANAIAYASALAASMDGSLTLLHVVFDETKTGFDKKKELALNAQLVISANEIKQKYGLKVKTVLEKGRPADVIIQVARQQKVGLIVTGAKDTAAGSGLVGGLVYDLMHASIFPVLAVPQICKFHALDKITLALDPSSRVNYNDEFLHELIEAHNAQLTILTVVTPGESRDVARKTARISVEQRYAETMHKILAIENTNLPKGILHGVRNSDADLVVIIPHRNHFLDRMMKKSKTQQVMKDTSVPLLALPRY